MELSEQMQSVIGGFAGYQDEEHRRISDEQIRAFVGERLVALPAATVDALSGDDLARYERLLMRCEFVNQLAFTRFKDASAQEWLDAVAAADLRLVSAAQTGDLAQIESAFDRRDAAMQNA
jgi:hypothetical protein